MRISDWSSDVCSSDLLAGLLGKIEEDRPGLEQRYGTAAIGGLGIDDRRDTVVGRDRQEIGRELLALADVHRHDPIGQARLLQEDRDLMAIGSGPVIKIDNISRLSSKIGRAHV